MIINSLMTITLMVRCLAYLASLALKLAKLVMG